MSRDIYGGQSQRSPKPSRREMTQVGQGSPSKNYPSSLVQPSATRGSPIASHSRTLSSPSQPRKSRHLGGSRSSNSSPLTLPPEGHVPHSLSSSAFNVSGGYYGDELSSPIMDTRAASAPGHHRSRSTTRGNPRNYHSLERDHEREFMPIREPRERSLDRGDGPHHHRARERSLDRLSLRDGGLDDDPYRDPLPRTRQSPNPDLGMRQGLSSIRDRDAYIIEMQNQLSDMQKEYNNIKKELEITNQKLGSSMHSIKSFWSPELKKERALRKDESTKYCLINDQLKLLNSENQKQASLIQQLEEELRQQQMRNPDLELQQQLETLYAEKQHQAKEIYLLRETIKEMEMRIETQKQTLHNREESIKKLLEMLQAKTTGGKLMEDERLEYERMKTQLLEVQARSRHLETLVESKEKDLLKSKEELHLQTETVNELRRQYECLLRSQVTSARANTLQAIIETKDSRISTLEQELYLMDSELSRYRSLQDFGGSTSSLVLGDPKCLDALRRNEKHFKCKLEEMRMELQKRDQEIMAMGAKMRTLEEQHQDYQRHIAVLKESLCAKEEHYNMLQTDVEELRQRLEEKNKLIEKKTEQVLETGQERKRLSSELSEVKEQLDIRDRKISVLKRKVELHEANERATVAAKGKEGQMQKLLEEKQKQIEEQQHQVEIKKKEVEEKKKEVENKTKEIEEKKKEIEDKKKELDEKHKKFEEQQRQFNEKQKALEEIEKRLKKRKEKLDEMETQMQKAEAGQNEVLARQIAELRKRNEELEKIRETAAKEVEKAKQDAQRSQGDLDRLLEIMKQSEEEKFAKDKQIKDLQDALKEKEVVRPQVAKPPGAQVDDARRRQDEAQREASRAQTELQKKQERVEELEEALRESVRITAEREVALAGRQEHCRVAEERISKLEQRLKSIQNAHNLRCTACPPVKDRVKKMEAKLRILLTERRKAMEELFEMKQEALTAAVSEKDAHIALLEMSGVKNYKIAEEMDNLKSTKKSIMEKIKLENEKRVRVMESLADEKFDLIESPPEPDQVPEPNGEQS